MLSQPECCSSLVSKPVQRVELETVDGRTAWVKALFDSGAFYSVIRENSLPPGAQILAYSRPRVLGTAAVQGQLTVTGVTELGIRIGEREIEDSVLVSPDLKRELLVGAKTMQAWDITIGNRQGHTEVHVGRDRRDPEITEVD